MESSSLKVENEHSKEGEHTDIDNFKFMELAVNAKVSLQNEYFKDSDYPATVSLLSCSGKYGYFVAGHNKGFVFGQTKDLRTTFYATRKGSTSKLKNKIIVPLDLPVQQVRLSCDEQTIIVALSDGTVFSYWAKDVLEQKNDARPKYAIRFNKPIIDLRPNNGVLPDSACVLFKDKECRIVNWKTGETINTISVSYASAICWSPEGKRLICGGSNGMLEAYDLKGVKQYSIPRPESLNVGDTGENVDWTVQDVLWINNDQFLVLYTRSEGTESDGSINAAYVVDQNPTSGATLKYTRLAQLPPVIPADRAYNHFYFEILNEFLHTIIILANSASNLISVVGQQKNGNWATWKLPQHSMASLPLSEEEDCGTACLGLALDFAACEKLLFFGANKNDAVVDPVPVPVLYCINDEGFIDAFNCYNQDMARTGTEYRQMRTAVALPSNSAFSSDPFNTAMKSGYSGKGFSALEKVKGATSPTLLGRLNTTTPIFGSATSFGASSTTSTASSNDSSPSSTAKLTASTTNPTTTNAELSSGVDAMENPKSTSPNSSSNDSTSSFEMVNMKDIDDLHRDDQVVPPTIKKITSKSHTATVPNVKSSVSVSNPPAFGVGPTSSNNKAPAFGTAPTSTSNEPSAFDITVNTDNTTTKAALPSANTFSFGPLFYFGNSRKNHAPGTDIPTFSGLAKMNTPSKPTNTVQQVDLKRKKHLPKESEDPYSKIMLAVEKMAAAQVGFQQQLQCQAEKLDNLTKNVEYLTDSLKKWQSMEHDQVRAVTQMKVDDIKDEKSNVSKSVSNLTKAEQTKQTLATMKDKNDFGRLECKDGDKLLAEMQFCIVNDKHGKQKESSTSNTPTHDFKLAIQEMEHELKKKDEDMMELKQLLALFRFREYQRKAQYSQSTIAFEDLTDDDEDDNNNAELEGQGDDPKVSATEPAGAATATSPTTKQLDEAKSTD